MEIFFVDDFEEEYEKRVVFTHHLLRNRFEKERDKEREREREKHDDDDDFDDFDDSEE